MEITAIRDRSRDTWVHRMKRFGRKRGIENVILGYFVEIDIIGDDDWREALGPKKK